MIYSLYTDFFRFIEAVERGGDRWRCFVRCYFGRHREFLSRVWFGAQNFTEDNIRERVQRIKTGDYAWLQGALQLYDIEKKTAGTLSRCESVSDSGAGYDAYLFIGFFSPDAFVIDHDGRCVICIGLERYHRFKHYPLLLAHEFCHCMINSRWGHAPENPPSRLVREGLAVYFSKIVFPGLSENEYLFLRAGAYNDLRRREQSILKKLSGERKRSGDAFPGAGGGLPNRLGYYIGYRMVTDFARRKGETDIARLIEHADRISMDFASS
jgi:hypothetical protein